MGHTSGPPNDADTQRAILTEAFAAGALMTETGAVHQVPWRWADEAWKDDPLSWSRQAQDAGRAGQPSGDTRGGRSDEPVWQNDDDRRAAEAVPWEEQCLVCIGLGNEN